MSISKYELSIFISFSPIVILVAGADTTAIGFVIFAFEIFTSPDAVLPSVTILTLEFATDTDVFEGTFFKLTLSILKLTFGTILFNLPFIEVFIDNVPLLILFSFNRAICPAASNRPFNCNLSAEIFKSASAS